MLHESKSIQEMMQQVLGDSSARIKERVFRDQRIMVSGLLGPGEGKTRFSEAI